MAALQYRIVTNWPASMQEDFVFAPTEDRNAHYDMIVELLSCIADEKAPERFRIAEQTTYEFDVKMPAEPVIPRMPVPTGALEEDAEFVEMCQRYEFADEERFSNEQSTYRNVHITRTETYVVEGRKLVEIAVLAKVNRAEAKLRFILGKFGVAEDELRRMNFERQFESFAKKGKGPCEDESSKDLKKAKKDKSAKRPEKNAEGKKSKKSKKGKKANKGKKGKKKL